MNSATRRVPRCFRCLSSRRAFVRARVHACCCCATGIYVRALQDLFAIASEEGSSGGAGGAASPGRSGGGPPSPAASSSKWHISVAMMEIYIEAVHDLLR